MLKMRIAIEEFIARKTLHALIDAGYYITVNDGEEDVVLNSRNTDECLKAMFSTDDDILYVDKGITPPDEPHDHFVRFIYGNSGHDVINDYSTALEEVLKPVNDLANMIDDGCFEIGELRHAPLAWNK